MRMDGLPVHEIERENLPEIARYKSKTQPGKTPGDSRRIPQNNYRIFSESVEKTGPTQKRSSKR